MSNPKLFRLGDNAVSEIHGSSVSLEKSLQVLIESNLKSLLGLHFLASEYSTGKTHAGRIDSLGIDENGCPCIVEYKRSTNENVINQGLYCLDWLLDHKGEFELLVLRTLGSSAAESIEWDDPRLLCIAGDFTKYDEHAVQQINRNIELIRYRRYGDELLLFEMVHAVTANNSRGPGSDAPLSPILLRESREARCIDDILQRTDAAILDLLESLKSYILSMGDDVQVKTLKWYIAFKRIRNFAAVTVLPRERKLNLLLHLDPDRIEMTEGFTRNVRNVGHLGTGDVEVTIRSREDLDRATPLIDRSYDQS